MDKLNIALVEDHKLVRQGFEGLLANHKRLNVVTSLGSAQPLLDSLPDLDIQILITDIMLPTIDGLTLAEKVKEFSSNIKVIVLSMFESIYYVEKAKALKIEGYISKRQAADLLINAIEVVSQGSRYFDPSLERVHGMSRVQFEKFHLLTEREREIFLKLAKGEQIKRIADHFDISIKTVHSHKAKVFKKLGVFDDFATTRLALKLGFIDVDDL